jgi:hypothetical protein
MTPDDSLCASAWTLQVACIFLLKVTFVTVSISYRKGTISEKVQIVQTVQVVQIDLGYHQRLELVES